MLWDNFVQPSYSVFESQLPVHFNLCTVESLEERALELSVSPSCHVPPETKPFPVKAGVKQWGCDTATDTQTSDAAAVTADLWWDDNDLSYKFSSHLNTGTNCHCSREFNCLKSLSQSAEVQSPVIRLLEALNIGLTLSPLTLGRGFCNFRVSDHY